MAEPKPFSDEELKQIEKAMVDMDIPEWKQGHILALTPFVTPEYRRFLDTIAVLQTRSRADRKRIEELEKENETLRVHFLSQITELRAFIRPAKRTLEKAMHVVCNYDPEQENAAVAKTISLNTTIADQAATIERLRDQLSGLKAAFEQSTFTDDGITMFSKAWVDAAIENIRQAIGKEEK